MWLLCNYDVIQVLVLYSKAYYRTVRYFEWRSAGPGFEITVATVTVSDGNSEPLPLIAGPGQQ
jgi:hypothetical protein